MLTNRRLDRLEIVGYSDSNFAGCLDNKRSTSSYIYIYIFTLVGWVISWKNVKQTLIASSTMEAEFIACFKSRTLSWGLHVVGDIKKLLKIFCDNKAAMFISITMKALRSRST